jgi:hypothetical protein
MDTHGCLLQPWLQWPAASGHLEPLMMAQPSVANHTLLLLLAVGFVEVDVVVADVVVVFAPIVVVVVVAGVVVAFVVGVFVVVVANVEIVAFVGFVVVAARAAGVAVGFVVHPTSRMWK